MRLQNKLFLSLVAFSTLLVVLMLGTMQWSVERGMLEYVNVQEAARMQPLLQQLAAHYEEHGGWQALEDDPQYFGRMLWQSRDPAQRPPLSQAIEQRRRQLVEAYPPPHRRAHKPRLVLLDAAGKVLIGREAPPADASRLPIVSAGQTVGWLVLPSRKRLTEGYELSFIEQQGTAFLAIGALVIGLALVFAFLLSRNLLRPIAILARATGEMTRGNYQPQLEVRRRDELGQLSRDFKELALSLQRSDATRKQWFADVSHELRTPLAILQAEIEALQDGVRPVNGAAIDSLGQEISQLGKLVEDLNTLSSADLGALQYHKQVLALDALVESQLEVHRAGMAASGLVLVWENEAPGAAIYGDPTRLSQLLDNLLANSRKYTEAPGKVEVRLWQDKGELVLVVQDSAPGVPEGALPALFDHLYRVEASRNRATGGSGLGLAICRRITEAHHGRIEARASALGGLAVVVHIPVEAGYGS